MVEGVGFRLHEINSALGLWSPTTSLQIACFFRGIRVWDGFVGGREA